MWLEGGSQKEQMRARAHTRECAEREMLCVRCVGGMCIGGLDERRPAHRAARAPSLHHAHAAHAFILQYVASSSGRQ